MFLLLSEDGNLYAGCVRILPALRLLKGRAVESRLVEGERTNVCRGEMEEAEEEDISHSRISGRTKSPFFLIRLFFNLLDFYWV